MHPDIEREAKAHARKTDRTFTQLVEQGLLLLIKTEKRRPRPKKVVLPTVGDPSGPKMTMRQYKRIVEEIYEEEARWYNRLIEGGR